MKRYHKDWLTRKGWTPRKVHVATLPQPSEGELGWAAGIFDGEGSLTLANRLDSKGNVRGSVRLSVGATDRAMIDRLQALFGGPAWDGGPPRQEGWKRVWLWHVSGRAVGIILKMIRPYVVVKGELADLAIEYAETINHSGRSMPPAVMARRAELVERFYQIRASVGRSTPRTRQYAVSQA